MNIPRVSEAEQIYKSIAAAADASAYFVDFLNRCLGVMSTFFKFSQEQKSGLALHLIFDCFSPFNCCLSVVLQLDKGDYLENLHVVFCPGK